MVETVTVFVMEAEAEYIKEKFTGKKIDVHLRTDADTCRNFLEILVDGKLTAGFCEWVYWTKTVVEQEN